jgi:hypothetical protein
MSGVGRLLGRDAEKRRVGALLEAARNGRGGAMLVLVEPGIGTTALLEATCADPKGSGLCGWMLTRRSRPSRSPRSTGRRYRCGEHLPALPDRQQGPLRIAAGAADGPPPDRYLIGLGVLGLLTAAGAAAPVVCTVDDTHLLDPESLDALAFVARRLEEEPVATVLAARDGQGVERQTAGIPTLDLAGLTSESAVTLLVSSLGEPVDPGHRADRRREHGHPAGTGAGPADHPRTPGVPGRRLPSPD